MASNFGLDLRNYQHNKGGACNSNFLIKTKKGRYMLTLVEERSVSESAVLAKLLLWLEKHRYPTTRLVKTIKDKNYLKFNGKAFFVKKYLKGKTYTALSTKQIKQAGASLACLHAVPSPEMMSDRLYYEDPKFEKVIGRGIDPKYEKWLKKRYVFFKENLPRGLPIGLIHADLFADNIIFDKKNLRAIIDFEEACHYYLIYDIGMAIIGTCMDGKKMNSAKARAFTKGYQKERKLTGEEIGALQIFMEYAAVRTSNWRIWKYHLDAPNPAKKNKHREMMATAEMIRKMPKKKFLKKMFGR
ncbi:MAG: homoserine kinase [Bacteroidota bacterium]